MTLRLQIETEGKGRSFSALVFARVYAARAWEKGRTERGQHRPALLLLGATHEEAGALAANLREGRKMRFFGEGSGHKGELCELLRSERFAVSTQRTEEGALILVRHPDLFSWAPGLVSADVKWVCLPPRQRLVDEARHLDLARTQRHLERCGFVPESEDAERARLFGRVRPGTRLVQGLTDPLFPAFAALFVAGIAQRVRFPILPEPLFWSQLTAALLADGSIAQRSPERCWDPETAAYAEKGVVESGYYPGAAVSASQEAIGEVLARETSLFLRS